MQEPLVSIITPVFNAEAWLETCIQSVFVQTYSNWELLLADDSSTDSSREIMEIFTGTDIRVKAFFLGKNSGTAVARNLAIEKAKGKYIAFLDADDTWKKNKLAVQVKEMEENNLLFTFSDYEVMNTSGMSLEKIIKCPKTITYRQLLKHNSIGCLTAMYNAEKLGKIYMPDITKRQDYGLWLSILRGGITGYGIQQNLACYRISPNSLSGNKFSVAKYNWVILRKYEKLNFISAVYYFCWFLGAKAFKYFS
ncbi:MAG: glycosyltransferase family 2 protein [Chitinophagales bacterium]